MPRFFQLFCLFLAVSFMTTSGDAKTRAPETELAPSDIVAGGRHWRLELPRGPVHVWKPAGYVAKRAGIVVYVHGYGPGVDETFTDHKLAEQFRDSRQNALFIVPEAPVGKDDNVRYGNLDELLREVQKQTHIPTPTGSIVAVGHSGAFSTLLAWVGAPRLRDVILLDALYAGQERWANWLTTDPRAKSHRLIAISRDTLPQTRELATSVRAVHRATMPAASNGFTAAERRARFLFIESQYRHLEIVTNRRVIRLLLQLTSLKHI